MKREKTGRVQHGQSRRIGCTCGKLTKTFLIDTKGKINKTTKVTYSLSEMQGKVNTKDYLRVAYLQTNLQNREKMTEKDKLQDLLMASCGKYVLYKPEALSADPQTHSKARGIIRTATIMLEISLEVPQRIGHGTT